jgi:tryptophan synthase alpha chain
MSSLISLAFNKAKKENRPALITYTVAGDNTKKKSLDILNSLSKNVDICELGFPHNTPIADGGQIQNSSYRAIKNGIKIKDVFQIVKKFKSSKNYKPIILMGYYNVIYQFGENKFLNQCKKSGVDGLIVVDLPWPENKPFAKKCKKKLINFIQLLSPTTSNMRLKKILKNYFKIKKINPNKNCVIGFGITENTISKLKSADGLVVGSAICKEISKSLKKRQNPVTNVGKMIKRLKNKIL